MKAVFYHLSFLFVSVASAMPITSIRDTEVLLDSSTTSHSLTGTMISMNSSITGIISTSDEVGDKSDDVSDTSEILGFNLSLFPSSSIFGANPMFQKLQESLRVIRDQLNTLWTINEDYPSFIDIPDNYVNSTLYSKLINGTLVTVNETIYKLTNQDGIQSFYHTKAISIYPENDSDSTLHKQHINHENGKRKKHPATENAAEEVEIENSTEIQA